MKITFLCLFVLVALAVGEYTVTDAQRACLSDSNCTNVEITCCTSCSGGVACNFDSLREIQAGVTAMCSNSTLPIACPMIACFYNGGLLNKCNPTTHQCERVAAPQEPVVTQDQLVCTSDLDCTHVCTHCCGCDCTHDTNSAVNKNSLATVQGAVTTFCQAGGRVICPMIACLLDPNASFVDRCVRSATGAASGFCARVDETPARCRATGCNGDICSTTDVFTICALLAVMPTCEESCKRQYRECGLTTGGCDWTFPLANRAAYEACLAACPTIVPAINPPNGNCPTCPPGVPMPLCFRYPCDSLAHCPGDPNAFCCQGCGSCDAVWYRGDGSLAHCDVPTDPVPCAYRTCGGCILDPKCGYCGSDSLTVSGVSGQVPQVIGQCVLSANIAGCLEAHMTVASGSAAICPTLEPIKTGDATIPIDPTVVQGIVSAEVTNSATLRALWTVVITLIERQAHSGDVQLVNVFLTLIGTAVPTDADHAALCTIVNHAVATQVSREANELSCSMGTVTSQKRDSSMIAVVSYKSMSSGATLTIAFGALMAVLLNALL